MQEVRAAVIGTGVMGRKYAQMIAEGKAGALRLTAVVCRSAGAQQWAKDALPDTVRVCPSAEALYDYAEEFDAVLVVTPHKTHPELVMQAFAHGKHVLCDKPSANALAPALEMNRAAEESGLVFAMMFHQRRYKKYMRLKKLLDDGTLGEIKRVQLENSRYFRTWMYHRSGSWRSSWAGEGGGALLNQGQHILDIWQWLFGMPTSIYAVIPYGKYNDFMVDDEATLLMEYPQQRTATFILSTPSGWRSWAPRAPPCWKRTPSPCTPTHRTPRPTAVPPTAPSASSLPRPPLPSSSPRRQSLTRRCWQTLRTPSCTAHP